MQPGALAQTSDSKKRREAEESVGPSEFSDPLLETPTSPKANRPLPEFMPRSEFEDSRDIALIWFCDPTLPLRNKRGLRGFFARAYY
jgi:hypothetical protein